MIHLQYKQETDDLHNIQGIKGAVISWQAAKSFGILPMQYSNQINNKPAITMIDASKAKSTADYRRVLISI